MGKLKTTNEYKLEVHEKYPHIEVLGIYQGGNIPILHKCNKCGYTRKVAPKSLFQTKYGCPKCAKTINAQLQTYTHEQFISKLKNINPNIEILSEYKKGNEKVACRCLIDGYEWNTTPSKLINAKHGCPKCGGSLKLTHEEFIQRVLIINPDITILEQYINDGTKILARCNKCGHYWKISPTHIYDGRGCPKCANLKRHDYFVKTQDKFESEMAEINPNIKVIGKYINSSTKIECECKICGKIWSASPANLLKGRGCPRCAASSAERIIEDWLIRHSIDYIYEATFEKCYFKHKLPFDFYLPKLNMCIEYDGEQHFYPIKYTGMTDKDAQNRFYLQKKRDQIKNEYCASEQIFLLRIPYWEYTNIPNILEKHIS